MRIAVGVLALVPGLLYVGQVISVANLELAQRLGLQEKPGHADPLLIRLEQWTARWDLLWIWTLPVAGILMLIDHAWWPYVAMIGGAALVDTAGREGAKWLGLRAHGLDLGSSSERRTYVSALVVMLIAGALAIAAGLVEVV